MLFAVAVADHPVWLTIRETFCMNGKKWEKKTFKKKPSNKFNSILCCTLNGILRSKLDMQKFGYGMYEMISNTYPVFLQKWF